MVKGMGLSERIGRNGETGKHMEERREAQGVRLEEGQSKNGDQESG